MGYHVSIVRTSAEDAGESSSIYQSEVIETATRLGFSIKYNQENEVELISKGTDEEEVTLFFDNSELWAKNPSDLTLESMLEIANVIGNEARVRGDEGETYTDRDTTFTHPHDFSAVESAKSHTDWKGRASWIVPILGGSIFILGVGSWLIKILMRKFGG